MVKTVVRISRVCLASDGVDTPRRKEIVCAQLEALFGWRRRWRCRDVGIAGSSWSYYPATYRSRPAAGRQIVVTPRPTATPPSIVAAPPLPSACGLPVYRCQLLRRMDAPILTGRRLGSTTVLMTGSPYIPRTGAWSTRYRWRRHWLRPTTTRRCKRCGCLVMAGSMRCVYARAVRTTAYGVTCSRRGWTTLVSGDAHWTGY